MTPHPRILVVGLLLIAAVMSGSPAAREPQVGHQVSAPADLEGQLASPDEFGRLRYIIRFADPGARERYVRTNGDGRGFGWTNAATRALVSRIIQEQDARLSRAGRSFGRSLQPTHRYLAGQSAVALWLSPDEAQELARMPDVVSVQPDQIYKLDTFRGPEFIGAGAIWDGSAVPGQTALRGEGMVVAIIDSGITAPAEHDAFANDSSCGHGSEAPDKLISALDCATATGGLCDGPDPLDHNGHGSHVAATAAGNRLGEGVASPELAVPGAFDEISGVAPCAHVRSYKVCPGRSCFGTHILAAIESILLHADVDVVNYSISGGDNPWNDLDRPKLDLIDAGVLVAASAGNAGPTPGTVSHRGPWLMSVGASSRDVDSAGNPAAGDVLARFSSRGPTPAPFENLQKPDIAAPGSGIFAADRRFFVSASGPGTPPDATRDIALWPGSDTQVQTPPFLGRAITRDPGQDPENDGCLGFPADFFAGSVALVRRGGCAFSTKINNAFEAGADFILVYNSEFGGFRMNTAAQESEIDAFSISGEAGQALKDVIDASGGVAELDYLIPAGYGFKSGTSMSSPHVAGAAALVRQAHPDWTPMEVHSALRMSSVRSGLKDGSTPWDWDDVGSGRVDLTGAARVGLVMDESAENFAAADPDQAGDVRTLNLPAIRDMNCQVQCTFTRTVRNALATPSRWSVSGSGFDDAFAVDIEPAGFVFSGDPAEQEVLTITVTPSTDLTESVAFGAIDLVELDGQSPPLHWTAAIRSLDQLPPIADITPAGFEFDLQANGSASAALSIANRGQADLVFRIDQAEPFSVKLEEANESLQETEGPSEPIALVVDALEGAFDGVGVADQSILWFNRFTPEPLDLPFVLETVQYLEAPGSSLGLREGDLYDAYVWSSPDGDPISGNEVLLAAITGQQMGASVGLIDIPLPDGGVAVDAATGDVLIGVVNRTRRDESFPAVSDGSAAASQQRSWILSNFPGGEPADPPVFANAGSFSVVDDTVVGGRNWIIRGHGTGGSACLAPGDVSWLAVTPQSGSVAQDETAALAIDVNMEGLGTGAFEARLCIETNDPELPVAVVPVNLEVLSKTVFSDRFEGAEQ